MKNLLLLCVLSMIGLFSCANPNQWSLKTQQQWLDYCNNRFGEQGKDPATTKAFCNCMLDKIQYEYSSLKESLDIPEEKQKEYMNICKDQ